jgi:hypothetical protein
VSNGKSRHVRLLVLLEVNVFQAMPTPWSSPK